MESTTNNLRQKTIVALGRTGAGKSYMLNRICRDEKPFKEGGILKSCTDGYIKKEVTLIDGQKAILHDTIGFGDNSGIDPDIHTKLCEFLRDLKDGISVVLLIIDIGPTRLQVADFKECIDLFQEKIFKKCLFILNPVNNDNKEYLQKQEQLYKTTMFDILNNNKIKIPHDDDRIVYFNGNINLIIEKINSITGPNSFPKPTKVIINSPTGNDTATLVKARLENVVNNNTNKFKNINKNAENTLKRNPEDPDAQEQKSKWEKYKLGIWIAIGVLVAIIVAVVKK